MWSGMWVPLYVVSRSSMNKHVSVIRSPCLLFLGRLHSGNCLLPLMSLAIYKCQKRHWEVTRVESTLRLFLDKNPNCKGSPRSICWNHLMSSHKYGLMRFMDFYVARTKLTSINMHIHSEIYVEKWLAVHFTLDQKIPLNVDRPFRKTSSICIS